MTDEPKTTRIAPQGGAAIKILHIEDDPSVARAMARMLRLHGSEVISAVSGDEAIQLIEDGLIPDLILADYCLPLQMTGDQVVIEIKTRLGFKPPTILLARSIDAPDVNKVMASFAFEASITEYASSRRYSAAGHRTENSSSTMSTTGARKTSASGGDCSTTPSQARSMNAE